MDISTPVLAAIIGSIVAGVISLVVNIISLLGQYKINKINESRVKRLQWEREVVSLVKELRRESMRMNLDGEDDEIVDSLIKDIESKKDQIPPKYNNLDVKNRLEDLSLTQHDFEHDSLTRPEYRSELIEKTEAALDYFEDNISKTSDLY